MKKRIIIATALTVLTPLIGTVSAQTYGNPHELECRQELNLVGVELQPGPVKELLRECIRDKVDVSHSASQTTRPSTSTKQQEILNQVLEQQKTVIPQDGLGSSATRVLYEKECRAVLNIGANQVLLPGPLRGSLERCIKRKTSEASRQASTKKQRTSVEEKKLQIQQQLLNSTQTKRQEQFERTRVEQQIQISPRRSNEIIVPTRAQSYYQKTQTGSAAYRKQQADRCRLVPISEWGDCIRNALNPTQ